MTDDLSASGRITVEEYTLQAGFAPSEIVSFILDGQLEGTRIGSRWYVAKPLVRLERQDSDATGSGVLRLDACKIGRYVTAGRGELRIPLRYDDKSARIALQKLDRAMKKQPVMPLDLTFNEQRFLIDSSLWVDLGAALLEFQVLNDPGPDSDRNEELSL